MNQTLAELIEESRKAIAESQEIRARGEERRRLADLERRQCGTKEAGSNAQMVAPAEIEHSPTAFQMSDRGGGEIVGDEVPNDDRMIDQPAHGQTDA